MSDVRISALARKHVDQDCLSDRHDYFNKPTITQTCSLSWDRHIVTFELEYRHGRGRIARRTNLHDTLLKGAVQSTLHRLFRTHQENRGIPTRLFVKVPNDFSNDWKGTVVEAGAVVRDFLKKTDNWWELDVSKQEENTTQMAIELSRRLESRGPGDRPEDATVELEQNKLLVRVFLQEVIDWYWAKLEESL